MAEASASDGSLSNAATSRFTLTWMHAVFFLSGVAGLGYQLAWTRMFAVGLGHEMPSVLAVVAAFFGGLALGAWALDGFVSRSLRPGSWYVGLEVVVGVWGLVSLVLIGWFNALALRFIGLQPSPQWQWLVSFTLPLLVLLPATTAMGGTLPAMERFVAPMVGDGRCLGGLYAANTAGAVVGTLASAFVIMPWAGYRATVVVLATVNLCCAAAVWPLGVAAERQRPMEPDSEALVKTPRWRMGVTVFFTGLLGIGYEVLGIRVMSQVLENTIYSFAAVLSVYLIGGAIGAAVYQRFGRRIEYEVLLGHLLSGIATLCMAGALLLSVAKPVYAWTRKNLFGDDLLGVMAAEMSVATMVFLLPTILMGATFSHLVQNAKRREGGVGSFAAVNTLGGALAPLAFGVVLMPWLGVKWSLVALSLAYLPLIPRKAGVSWLIEAAPVLLVLAVNGISLQIITKHPQDRVIAYREGVMAAVAVVEDAEGHRSLRVNNRFQMGTTRGWVEEGLQAHVPLLLHPAPQRALFLGLGTAITFRSSSFQPGLVSDGVELIPEVIREAGHFEPANLPEDAAGRLNVFAADARRFVRVSEERYDVIVADLFHPARNGAGSLYTREHFEAVRERLSPGGVFCQWLPLYQLDEPLIRVVVRTFLEVYPNTRAFLVDFKLDHPMLGLVATEQPVRYAVDWFESRVHDPPLRQFLRAMLVRDGVRLFGALLADTEELRQYAGHGPINTDNYPLVTFRAPAFASRADVTPHGRLQALLAQCKTDARNVIDASDTHAHRLFTKRLDRYIQARNVFLNGLFAAAEGRESEAYDKFIESVQISPDFLPGYAHCLNLAQGMAQDNPEAVRDFLERLTQARPDRNEASALLTELFGSGAG